MGFDLYGMNPKIKEGTKRPEQIDYATATEEEKEELKNLRKELFDLCYSIFDIINNNGFIIEQYHKNELKDFIDYLKSRNFSVVSIHSSGHADIDTLKELANAVNPKFLIPIHTFKGNEYKKHFSIPILELKDKQVRIC